MILICDHCGTEFERDRIHKECKLHFCCKQCKDEWNTDDFKEFRKLANRIKTRTNKKKWSGGLSKNQLHDIFQKQGAICPYSGKQLLMGEGKQPYQASVDRIDSSRPYTDDNVEFVSLIAQYAKNTFSREDVIQFCRDVVEYQNSKAG